jgi:hypothetical protein
MKRILPLAAALILAACNGSPDVVFTGPDDTQAASESGERVASSASSTAAVSKPVAAANTSQPRSVKIEVPFVPQAPFANWDDLHQEACEEMSLILVKAYLEKNTITFEQAEAELQDLVAWQTATGYPYDITAEEIARIAKDKYGLNAKATYDITVDDIKREIAKGNPVIVPAAGQMLGNPYFSGDGPPYHMLVVTGYDDDEFITNDVGTKRGKDYRYDQDVFFEAIHDWTGSKETIEQGKRAMVVVTK